MDVKKCPKLPPSACKNSFHCFWIVDAIAQMYLSSIAALISSIAVLKSSMNVCLTLQTWSLTHPHRKKLQRLQSGECRGQETSNSHEMILSPLNKFRIVLEQWALSPSCCHVLTWPVTDELLPARPDCEQIIKSISNIIAELPASSTIHLTTSPFLPMSQTHVITLPFPSQICLFVFGILWHPGDIIFSILGLGEEDNISHHSQKAAQGVSACKW